MNRLNFYDLTLPQMEAHLKGLGKERFRARQLFNWVYKRGVTEFAQMSNLSKAFRQECSGLFDFVQPRLVSNQVSTDGTRKFLCDVGEGRTVESVVIPAQDRLTLCVSSEVGCNMACQFCYTAKQKLQRRLDAFEIVGQFLRANEGLEPGQRITNVVFMGMGEPLDNLESVLKAVDILCEDHGLNFGRRKITVSTSGLVPLIPSLIPAKVRLAVSLNATTDAIRDVIMPINRKYPIEMLLDACRDFASQTGDRVTMEYVLLRDVNDFAEDAQRLARLLSDVPCKINLIAFNEHEGSDFKRPSAERVSEFQNILIQKGFTVFVRRSMGRDIYAACGQLRSNFENHPGWRHQEANHVEDSGRWQSGI